MKTLLLYSILFCSIIINAQNKKTQQINTRLEPINLPKPVKRSPLQQSHFLQKTTNTTGSAWFNQLDFLDLISAPRVVSAMHIFPDSAIILGFGTGNVPVNAWIHKAANYIDPVFMAQQTIITDNLATYTLDSIAVGYLYERHSSNSIKDSLIFQVVGENHALDWTTSTGTFPYQDITYNYLANDIATGTSSLTPILQRYAIALNIQDTCGGGVYKQIKIATSSVAPQTNSKKIGVVISYKPGYTYTINDTLVGSHRTNTFYILSSEQNGVNTDPTVFGTAGDYTSDMNMSYVLPTDVRYDMNVDNWNGYFLPTYAYTTPFAYESHDIGYKLTVSITGVTELEQKGFSLSQNIPNPFTKESTVKYDLVKDVSLAIFTITDVTGRIISSEKIGTTIGNHSIKLGAYASGLYYYSLNVDGNVTTKKMIVE